MIDVGSLGDVAFVVAAYGVILGGVGLYAVSLARRLRRAQQAASAGGPPQPGPAEPPTDQPA